MSKVVRKLMNKPVIVDLFDREARCTEQIGGGIEGGESCTVLILRELGTHWLTAQWRHSGQFIVVPIVDVVCIASDLAK